jgi:hypothetical protein
MDFSAMFTANLQLNLKPIILQRSPQKLYPNSTKRIHKIQIIFVIKENEK